ncbi:MAG TPA: hypothetical protein VF547_02140 [Allosphingosinicella sp.]
MTKPLKELVASTGDQGLKVFVRTASRELTLDDLEVIAGGRGARWDPYG